MILEIYVCFGDFWRFLIAKNKAKQSQFAGSYSSMIFLDEILFSGIIFTDNKDILLCSSGL